MPDTNLESILYKLCLHSYKDIFVSDLIIVCGYKNTCVHSAVNASSFLGSYSEFLLIVRMNFGMIFSWKCDKNASNKPLSQLNLARGLLSYIYAQISLLFTKIVPKFVVNFSKKL